MNTFAVVPHEVIGQIILYLSPRMIYRLFRKGFHKCLAHENYTVIADTVVPYYMGPIKCVFDISKKNKIVTFGDSYYETYTDSHVVITDDNTEADLFYVDNNGIKMVILYISRYIFTSIDYSKFIRGRVYSDNKDCIGTLKIAKIKNCGTNENVIHKTVYYK